MGQQILTSLTVLYGTDEQINVVMIMRNGVQTLTYQVWSKIETFENLVSVFALMGVTCLILEVRKLGKYAC